MHLRRLLALPTALLFLLPVVPAASAATVDPTCGSPLGTELENGANLILYEAPDPEYDLVDAFRMPGAQRSAQTIVSAWGKLVLVAEAKVDAAAPSTNFTWAIFVRIHSNETGWNTTPIWLSSIDPSQHYPVGVHVSPSAAIWNDLLWVAWDAQGSSFGGPNDRMILLRSLDQNGSVGATRVASSTDPTVTTQHPVLAAESNRLELVYSTADGDPIPGDSHIVARSFNGAAFLPTQAVSNLSDGWGDGLPAIASDGSGRLFVAWTSTNTTGATSRVMFAWRDANAWQAPTELAQLGSSPSSAPAVAVYGGRVYIAYSTDFFPDLNGTDSEVRWITFDPTLLTFGPPQTLNPEPSNGDDAGPTLANYDGTLLVGWTTSEDFYYSRGADPDAVYRGFDGVSFGPLVELSDPAANQSDASPHFVQVGGHLYAHWMMTPPQVEGAPRGDAREGIRLVSRPNQWYDGLEAHYAFPETAENGSARIAVTVYAPGVNLSSGQLKVRVPGGALFPLINGSAWTPVNPAAPDFEILACGAPILAVAQGPVVCDCVESPLKFILLAAGALAFLVLAAYLLKRKKR